MTLASGGAERLYYDSAELSFHATVTDIQLVAQERNADGDKVQLWRVALDRTAFYPESGGQPWDTGVLTATARSGAVLEVAVERVEEDETGEVWHFVRKPLIQGTELDGRVDADRRMDHMQQHTGQHLLSAVFLARLHARTVSFHLGAESSTIDLALPENLPAVHKAHLIEVEDAANRLVFEDRPLRARWHTQEEAAAMLARGDLRKLPERTGRMRVVEMAGVEFNACGGTHVASTGAIGSLQLRRLEKVKAGWRVEFLCGRRAVRAARRDFETLSDVARTLSVGNADVPQRVAALGEETKAGSKARRSLLEELAEAKAAELTRQNFPTGVVQAMFANKPVDFAKSVASSVSAAGRSVVIGVSQEGNGAVSVALPGGDARHAGNLLREVSASFDARGGGGPQLAQGVCDSGRLNDLVHAIALRLQGEAAK